jgi:Na+/phosphate symporter
MIPLTSLQFPFDFEPPTQWFGIMNWLLNLILALSTRGYLLLILVGLMVFATGLSDSVSKHLIGFGVGFYFLGPYVVAAIAQYFDVTPATPEDASLVWYNMVGLSYLELVSLLVILAEIIVAIIVLVGVILYFTPSSRDLKTKGHSLVIRGIVLASILAFIHAIPWV